MGVGTVSVVITTYKREFNMLKKAIDSVFSQTYKNIEVIVVDDNGMGTSFQEMNKVMLCKNSKIIYIANKENYGSQYSRNIGILTSNGEYVSFLDDDDFWVCDKIEKQMKLFDSNKVGFVYCNGYKFIDGKDESIQPYYSDIDYVTEVNFGMMLYADYIGSTSQIIIRKDCFARVGLFDPDLKARQDYEMWIRLSKFYKGSGLSEKLFYHRMHDGEQISKNLINAYEGYLHIYRKYKEDYREYHKAKVNVLLRLSGACFRISKPMLAFYYLGVAFLCGPFVWLRIVSKKIYKYLSKLIPENRIF